MKIRVGTYFLLGVALAAIVFWWALPLRGSATDSRVSWNREAAAQSLDQREIWWQNWPRAQKDHGTLCISCHTVVPYALSRPGMQRQLGETEMPAPEKVMIASVEKRVSGWSDMAPFYSDAKYGAGKAAESRATEAVLNAVILVSYDTKLGHLRPITRSAFNEAWALQQTTAGSGRTSISAPGSLRNPHIRAPRC